MHKNQCENGIRVITGAEEIKPKRLVFARQGLLHERISLAILKLARGRERESLYELL
jgi:hypothetical protein